MNDYDELLSSVKELAAGLQALHRLAVEQLTPIVEVILRSRSRDVRHIEQTLDRLLDHCCYDPALLLYRRLCRHYWEIDPVATVSYINAYRELWDTTDEPSEETASPSEPQGASRGFLSAERTPEPAASAVPLTGARP